VPAPSTFYGFALLAMLIVFVRRGRSRSGLSSELAESAFCGVTGGLIGARVFYWIQHGLITDFTGFLSAVTIGGTASWGAYIGTTAGLFTYRRLRGLPVLPTLDLAASVAGLGIAIGRLSCFLNGDDYGTLSTLPWSVRFPPASLPFAAQVRQGILAPDAVLSLGVHPVQLYLALNGLALFCILSVLWRRLCKRPGLTLIVYLSVYGVTRFTLEFFRGDQVRYTALHWSVPQLMSIATLTLCVFIAISESQPRLRWLKPGTASSTNQVQAS
jgi:phosphatidylglycerol---prolipoprotein diacylglyceryl transferase